MFRYETHMHTAEASACSNSPAADLAEKYKSEGYDGIIITDHFFNGNTCIDKSLPWKERVEAYCKGYEHAKEKGDEIGLDVFFGMEYGDGTSDFLIYGPDKDWLKENDHILDMEVTAFLEYARSFGFVCIQAHPFRQAAYTRGTVHCPKFVDGIEIFNASQITWDPAANDHAEIYASWYDLPVTGGSDTHNTTDRFYAGGVLCPRRLISSLDYGNAVRAREVEVIRPSVPSGSSR